MLHRGVNVVKGRCPVSWRDHGRPTRLRRSGSAAHPGAEPHPSRRVGHDRAPAGRLDGVPGVGLRPWRGHGQTRGRSDRGRDRADRPPSRGRRRCRTADHDGRRWRICRDVWPGGGQLSLPGVVARRVQDRCRRNDRDRHRRPRLRGPEAGRRRLIQRGPDDDRSDERLRGGPGWTVLRLLGAEQHHAHVPVDRTRRHRAADRIGRRHAAGPHRARSDAPLLGLVGQRPDARAHRR